MLLEACYALEPKIESVLLLSISLFCKSSLFLRVVSSRNSKGKTALFLGCLERGSYYDFRTLVLDKSLLNIFFASNRGDL